MNESEYTTCREGTCACGAVFPGPKRGPIPALCPECKRRHRRGLGRGYYAVLRDERAAHPQPVDKSGWIQCPYCPDLMPARRKQCGKPECKRAFNAARNGPFAKAWRDRMRAQGLKRRPSNCYEHVCLVCCRTFKSHKVTQAHCSPDCYQRRNRQMILHPHPSPCSVLHPKHPARTWAPSSSGRVWVAGRCGRCAKPFVIVDQLEARFCSPKCLRKACKDARRAKLCGVGHEPYRPVDIFERDGWRCHICGRKTRRDVHYSHPLSPTIDHLVPVTKDGIDAPVNLACAHRQCNCIKSDTGCAQLRLTG